MRANNSAKERMKSTIQRNIQEQDERRYAVREKKRISIGREKRILLILGIGTLLATILSILMILDLSYRGFSIAWLVENMQIRTREIFALITGGELYSGINFFICEFIAALVVGAALACSGVIYQGTFHNPMASPTLLGVTSGGTLGKVICGVFFSVPPTYTVISFEEREMLYADISIFQEYKDQLFVLAGCFIAVTIVVFTATVAGRGKVSTVGMILAGTVFASVVDTIIQVIQYAFSPYGNTIQSMTSASFSGVSDPKMLLLMCIPIIICLVIAFIMSTRINILVFGEEEAKSMGVDLSKTRLLLIVISTIMTAEVIAFCGQIAFIGLIIPNLARKIVGPDYRYLLPASALMGAAFLLITYDAAYSMGFILNVGKLASVVGGFLFMIIMTANRRKRHGDWA